MAKPLAKIVKLLTPKRTWAQFSLATMFVVVTVLCVWLAQHVQAVNRQRAAVATIRSMGGECFFDYEAPYRPWGCPEDVRPGPAWLREHLGIDNLANVTEVYLTGHLIEFDLDGEALSDREVATKMDLLLEAVALLPNLDSLDLDFCTLGESGLQQIGRMTQLRALVVRDSPIGDDGLASIVRLNRLSELDLDHSEISDTGLVQLQRLTRLSELYLDERKITDAGLAHLQRLTALRKLGLVSPRITDAGLVALRQLAELRELTFYDANITDEEIADLQKTLPNCEVRGEWPHGRRDHGRPLPVLLD